MNTMQQEFDAVVAHLYKQGRPSKDDGKCLYRSAEGLSCAVGCRIPDALYDKRMDVMPMASSSTVLNLVEYFGNALPPEIVEYQFMFSDLQYAHDSCPCTEEGKFDLYELERELGLVAGDFNLTFTPPQQGE